MKSAKLDTLHFVSDLDNLLVEYLLVDVICQYPHLGVATELGQQAAGVRRLVRRQQQQQGRGQEEEERWRQVRNMEEDV